VAGRALWDVIETGMGARDQPLMWATTTAGEEGEEDVYGQEHTYGVQVLEGVVEDDARFAYIATLDPDDDWTDPANFIKANPNLGVSVEAAEIAAAVRKAEESPAAVAAVKRLRLDIRAQDSDAWIPLSLWDAGREPRLTWESLRGFPCYGALDLASTADFAALSLLFPLSADLTPAPDPTGRTCSGSCSGCGFRNTGGRTGSRSCGSWSRRGRPAGG
jgi:phage terminase large subunit-like protein